MERKVGEKFYFLGYTLKVEKSQLKDYCSECFFYKHKLACQNKEIRDVTGECNQCLRQDDNEVIFKEQ